MQRTFQKIEDGFLILLIIVSAVVVCYGVIMRYIVGDPLIWSEEIVCYFQVWIAFVGISCVARNQDDFIRFDFLRYKMGPKMQRFVFFVEHILLIAFMGLMVAESIKWIIQVYDYGGISTPMMVPNYIPRIAVPLSFVLMLIHFVSSLIREIIRLRNIRMANGGDLI